MAPRELNRKPPEYTLSSPSDLGLSFSSFVIHTERANMAVAGRARTYPPMPRVPTRERVCTNGICIFQIISRKMLSGASLLCNGPIFPSSSLLLFSVLHSLPPPQPPPSPPITRSFGVVSLSSSLISTWVHTDVAESIPRFFPNCTPLCPQSRKN